MTSANAFCATYSDIRCVKSRKVAQIVLELPIEQADAFVKAFGMPNPTAETWVAIARLDPQKAQEPEKAKRSFNELPPSQQAALRCNDARFWKFLTKHFGLSIDVSDEKRAADIVRKECGVTTRAEFDCNYAAGQRWKALDGAYWAWSRGME